MNLQGEPLRVGRLVHAEERDVTPEAVRFYCDTFGDRHPAYSRTAEGGPIARRCSSTARSTATFRAGT